MKRSLYHNPNNDRVYSIHITTDLLGDMVLIRRWGNQKTMTGEKVVVVNNVEHALDVLDTEHKNRLKKGYVIL